MTIELITDHAERASARLAVQYGGTVTHEGIVRALGAQVQEIEQAQIDTYLQRLAFASSGDRLDLIGDLVGRKREGRDDVSYRLWLQAQVVVNKSSGTVPEILQVLGLILASPTLLTTEYFPGSLEVEVPDPVVVDPEVATPSVRPAIVDIFKRVIAGGVHGIIRTYTAPVAWSFMLGDSAGGSVAGQGFVDPATSTTNNSVPIGHNAIPLTSTASFPASGTAIIEPGTGNAEIIAYAAKDVNFLYLSTLATKSHPNGSTVVSAIAQFTSAS